MDQKRSRKLRKYYDHVNNHFINARSTLEIPCNGGNWIRLKKQFKLIPLRRVPLDQVGEFFPEKAIYNGDLIQCTFEITIYNN